MTGPHGTPVLAPLAGRVVALSDVPDPVFAQQMVGAGVAIEPAAASGLVTVHSPVAGTLLKLHPHAFVVFTAEKKGVLVHVGIDTVQMKGAGFTLAKVEGEHVDVGETVVTYDPAALAHAGFSDVCPVVVMDSKPDTIAVPSVGSTVAVGDPLFRLP